jgi:excisionase family DNA binding protein
VTPRKRRTVGDVPEGVVWTAPRWLSRRDAAERLGVSLSKLDGLARDGQLKRIYVGRKPLFPLAALDQWADWVDDNEE